MDSSTAAGIKLRAAQLATAASGSGRKPNSRLQRRIGHRSTQRIDPKCTPQVSHTTLLQLSPMSSGIACNRRVPNSNRPRPVVARHKHAATKRTRASCVTSALMPPVW